MGQRSVQAVTVRGHRSSFERRSVGGIRMFLFLFEICNASRDGEDGMRSTGTSPHLYPHDSIYSYPPKSNFENRVRFGRDEAFRIYLESLALLTFGYTFSTPPPLHSSLELARGTRGPRRPAPQQRNLHPVAWPNCKRKKSHTVSSPRRHARRTSTC